MNLDKRSHDFLLYMELRNYIDDDKVITKDDLRWIIHYLQDRLEFYTSEEGRHECFVQNIKENESPKPPNIKTVYKNGIWDAEFGEELEK